MIGLVNADQVIHAAVQQKLEISAREQAKVLENLLQDKTKNVNMLWEDIQNEKRKRNEDTMIALAGLGLYRAIKSHWWGRKKRVADILLTFERQIEFWDKSYETYEK